MKNSKRSCLIVIDGWGISPPLEESEIKLENGITVNGNAIQEANTPIMDSLQNEYPNCSLFAHGLHVGLPKNLMGNSEVGHLNIGAGRVVFQDIVRIDESFQSNRMSKNQTLLDAFKAKRVHFIGLVSDGGVHSHIKHLKGLLMIAKSHDIEAFIHVITDGRDTSPYSALEYIQDLDQFCKNEQIGQIVTIVGRYYAMDRDKRWERTQIAIDAFVSDKGQKIDKTQIQSTIEEKYNCDERDEFLKPIIVDVTDSRIQNSDSVILFNYRSDRMRQIASVFGKLNFNVFTMTSYSEDLVFPIISPPQKLDMVLAESLSKQKQSQLHVAETEKYAHVTFFFNGGRELPFDGEDRILIPSPKVPTYDLKPEMSVLEVANAVSNAIYEGKHDFIMCNLAPPDMVGHTGKLKETIEAVEATDTAIGKIFEACKSNSVCLFITSDHGNAEKMLAYDGGEHTAHTCQPVPFIATDKSLKISSGGSLCNIAPTILDYMNLKIPQEMSSKSLLQ